MNSKKNKKKKKRVEWAMQRQVFATFDYDGSSAGPGVELSFRRGDVIVVKQERA